MNRGSVIGIGVILAVIAVILGVWLTRKSEPDTSGVQPVKLEPEVAETPAPPPAVPEPVVPETATAEEAPEQPSEAALEAISRALQEAEQKQESDAPDLKPFEGVPITAESLTGCKYKQGQLEIEFAQDNRWLVNGKERAKWEIVGTRVRMYDDKGEEHWVDIEGDKLIFEGQRVELWK